jgi:hypothetical protein
MNTDRLEDFSDVGLTEALLKLAIEEHARSLPRLDQLWAYFRNALQPVGVGWSSQRTGGWYRQPQERGLPARIVGRSEEQRREVVIENDIAWRIQAMVDFMFGKPVSIVSTGADAALRRTIERVLDHVWEASGGIALLQDAALLGHVYGHVDLLVRVDEEGLRTAVQNARAESSNDHEENLAMLAAEFIRVEVIEPRRGIPILDEHDYRRLKAYIIHYTRDGGVRQGVISRLLPRLAGQGPRRQRVQVTEVIGPSAWHVYEDGALVWACCRWFTSRTWRSPLSTRG